MPNMQELLKSLVETEDKMERMKIVEENMEAIENMSSEPADNSEMEQKYNEALAEIEAQKQKYIDRFFSGATDVEETEETEVEEEVKESKSLDDILNDKGGSN